MTNLPEGFWTPVEAKPLLRKPDFNEPAKVMADGQDEAIDLLNLIQVSLAFRLGCFSVDPETGDKHANVPIDGIQVWKALKRPYDLKCHTRPTSFYAEIDPANEDRANVQYTLPLAASDKRAKAVVATYDYHTRKPDHRMSVPILRLGRSAVEKAHLGNNPFYVARASDNSQSPRSFSGYGVLKKALNDGRAGSTPL